MAEQQSNRGHRGFHRGRRGPDRRGGGQRPSGERGERGERATADSRPQAGGPAPIRTENADVAQIMRDIKARVAQKHGITLSDQQVEELAARRLEAVLDIRGVSPELLEQLRRAAGGRAVEVPTGPEAPSFRFEEDTLYETPRGLLRSMRRLFNPLLKLLFNPDPLVSALNTQARINHEAARREDERTRAQAEWNALHYALLQRLVSEIAKLSLENQHLAQQVESLSAKVDFNERRVRGLEGSQAQVELRSGGRESQSPRAEVPSIPGTGGVGGDALQGDGPRRKRRRRRGRRPGSGDVPGGGALGADGGPDSSIEDDGQDGGPEDGSEGGVEDAPVTAEPDRTEAVPAARVEAIEPPAPVQGLPAAAAETTADAQPGDAGRS